MKRPLSKFHPLNKQLKKLIFSVKLIFWECIIKYFMTWKKGGFVESVNGGNLERLLGKIIDDAKKGRLPSRYSIGLNVSPVKKEK